FSHRCSLQRRALHSFPTRRSSDLVPVVYNAAAPEIWAGGKDLRAALGLAADDFVALAVARLRPEKDLDVLLHAAARLHDEKPRLDRKSTRLNSSHDQISYAVFCLK